MSYAVIETGGSQFRVKEGDVIRVPLINAEVGTTLEFKPLTLNDGTEISIGNPVVQDGLVRGHIVGHGRDRKVLVFRFRRRKQYRKKKGHRQDYTAIRIQDISKT